MCLCGCGCVWVGVCVCVSCLFTGRREVFFFFFLEGGMSSVRRFSALQGGEREDAWRDEHCHSLCVLHVCFLLERFDEQVKGFFFFYFNFLIFLANACRFRALWSSEGV